MKSFHFHTIPSTQLYLKENYLKIAAEFGPHILVSADSQSTGIGRGNHRWDSWESGLYFSFSLYPNQQITLTSLEITALICLFFEKNFNLTPKIKWPNDLINSDYQKCGGMLLHNLNREVLICGVGINLFPSTKLVPSYQIPAGPLFDKKLEMALPTQLLPLQIYQFILESRLTPSMVVTEWNKRCAHLNHQVEIIDEEVCTLSGIFIGIGENGQALIKSNESDQPHHIYSGSLRLQV